VEYQDYTDSIDSVERAKATIEAGSEVSLLQRQSGLQSQAESVLQRVVSLKKIPDSARRALRAFLQTGEADDPILLEAQAPEGKTFESHSGGVLELVNGMGEQMEEKRGEVEKDEMQLKHAYDMVVQDITDFIENASTNRDKKASRKGELSEQKGQAEGDLAMTQKTLAEDKQFLEDLTIEQEQKDKDFAKRQEVRQGEIDAIGQAIGIMSSDDVSGAGSEHLPGLVQTAHVTALVQLRSNTVSSSQKDVAAFLEGRAKKMGSRLLALVAEKVKADPFKKVTKMIKDMIEKLMTEANEDATHKGFCDQELGTNKQTRDMKTEDVEELTATAQKLESEAQKLADDISRLSQEVTDIDASVAKATALREAEKAKNADTIADGKGAQLAVGKAMTILKEFYDKAAAQAFAQEHARPAGAASEGSARGAGLAQMPGAPDTFKDEAYTGMSEGGVLGMLETIESDFARLIAETTAAEQEAAADFKKFVADSSKDKAIKGTDINSKKGEKTRAESDLQAAHKDLKTTKEELGAAMDYYEKLKPSCVNSGTSYEERVARRKEEIESLKEALSILAEQFPDGS